MDSDLSQKSVGYLKVELAAKTEPAIRNAADQSTGSQFLGLRSKVIPFALLVAATLTPLRLAYDFAQKEREKLDAVTGFERLTHPLYYQGRPIAIKAVRDRMEESQHSPGWYRCIGKGEALVFIYTLIFLA
jgi:hypothetical protein